MRPTLERLERLEETPIAAWAEALHGRLEGCDRFVARCPQAAAVEESGAEDGPCRLPRQVACVDAFPHWAEELLAGSDWVLSRRASEGLWFLARARGGGDGSLDLEGEAGPVGTGDAISLLLPAAEPAGPPRLSLARALLHARVRPDGGIDLSRFVEGEGWGARMYRLRSDLFEGRALAGVWELAVYPPEEGELIPPLALAADTRDRELAIQAMERFLVELQEVWPVRRNDFALAGHPGACLGNVRVMPDLAPCYVATDSALVAGWNRRSLALALDRAAAPGDAPVASGMRAYLSRFPPADRVIAETTGAPATSLPAVYPWRLLELAGERADDVYRFRVRLAAEEASP